MLQHDRLPEQVEEDLLREHNLPPGHQQVQVEHDLLQELNQPEVDPDRLPAPNLQHVLQQVIVEVLVPLQEPNHQQDHQVDIQDLQHVRQPVIQDLRHALLRSHPGHQGVIPVVEDQWEVAVIVVEAEGAQWEAAVEEVVEEEDRRGLDGFEWIYWDRLIWIRIS